MLRVFSMGVRAVISLGFTDEEFANAGDFDSMTQLESRPKSTGGGGGGLGFMG